MSGSPGQCSRITTSVLGACPCATLLLVVVAVLSAPVMASGATGKEQARVEFEKAQIQYKLGHFDQALDGYARAYELFHAPAFLFNIGQCHKNLKNYERAIFFFEGYLREEKDPTKRRLAQELVDESRGELEQHEKQAARAGPSPPGIAPPPASVPPPAQAPDAPTAGALSARPDPGAAPVLVAAPAPGESDAQPARSRSSWWLWAGIGLAAAALAGGLIYWGTGSATTVLPGGTVGPLDRRQGAP